MLLEESEIESLYDLLEEVCTAEKIGYVRWDETPSSLRYPSKAYKKFCIDLGIVHYDDKDQSHRNVLHFSVLPGDCLAIFPSVRTILDTENFSPYQHRYVSRRVVIPNFGISDHVVCTNRHEYLSLYVSEERELPTRKAVSDHIVEVKLQLSYSSREDYRTPRSSCCPTCKQNFPPYMNRSQGSAGFYEGSTYRAIQAIILEEREKPSPLLHLILCPWCFKEGRQLSFYGYGVSSEFEHELVEAEDPSRLGEHIKVISSSAHSNYHPEVAFKIAGDQK